MSPNSIARSIVRMIRPAVIDTKHQSLSEAILCKKGKSDLTEGSMEKLTAIYNRVSTTQPEAAGRHAGLSLIRQELAAAGKALSHADLGRQAYLKVEARLAQFQQQVDAIEAHPQLSTRSSAPARHPLLNHFSVLAQKPSLQASDRQALMRHFHQVSGIPDTGQEDGQGFTVQGFLDQPAQHTFRSVPSLERELAQINKHIRALPDGEGRRNLLGCAATCADRLKHAENFWDAVLDGTEDGGNGPQRNTAHFEMACRWLACGSYAETETDDESVVEDEEALTDAFRSHLEARLLRNASEAPAAQRLQTPVHSLAKPTHDFSAQAKMLMKP